MSQKSLSDIRVELNDAPASVKSSFNTIIEYFANKTPQEQLAECNNKLRTYNTQWANIDKDEKFYQAQLTDPELTPDQRTKIRLNIEECRAKKDIVEAKMKKVEIKKKKINL